jgi:hypothetical protein
MAEKKDSAPPSDRRGGERHMACFPAYVEPAVGSRRTAMIVELSVTGALLLAQKAIEVGERVRLELFIFDDTSRSREAAARVVRTEALDEAAVGPWTCRIALQFDDPLHLMIYEVEIRALAERQARMRAER